MVVVSAILGAPMEASLSAETFLKKSPSQTLILSAGVVILGLALQLLRSSTKRLSSPPLPPGRFGLPFIGETLELIRALRGDRPAKFIEDRAALYGETFKTKLIGDPTVIACNPAGNKMVFTNENKLVNVSWPGSIIAVLGKNSLIALKGDEAKRIRQAMMTFLRPEALQMYMCVADKNVQAFIKEHWDGQTEVKVFPLMKKFTFALACELLMSKSENVEQESLEEPFHIMMKGILQLPINLPGTRFTKAKAAANMLRNRFQVWIDERRRDMAESKFSDSKDLLACFLSFRDENGLPLSDQDIKDNILLLLFAGHDTSTVVMTMVCRYLALNPEVFDEVYKENKEIAKEKDPNKPLSWADLQKMKLSWRVVQETMRLQPPVQGAFRVALQDFDHNGFRIPKAWKVYWSTLSTHLNPKYFSNPSKFDPSRFEGTGPAPYTFVPFGGGARMCPGNEFARMEALVLLHHIVMHYSWTLVDPNEKIIVDPMPYPAKGLPVRLQACMP